VIWSDEYVDVGGGALSLDITLTKFLNLELKVTSIKVATFEILVVYVFNSGLNQIIL
jgi:hypothetical protein